MTQLPRPFEILDKEAMRYVRRLTDFLGRDVVDHALDNYRKALESAGPVYGNHHIRVRHPWWEPFSKILALDAAGKSVWRHIQTPADKLFVGDAYKIDRLHPGMPDSVREKFKRDLVDDKNAWNYLLELQMAGHFYQRGHEIVWYEDEGQPRPEFRVVADSFEFDVECKRISADASRKIRRADFYRLAEKIVPAIQARGLAGHIDIALNDRLHSNEKHLDLLCTEILQLVVDQGTAGEFELPLGDLKINLTPTNGQRHEWAAIYRELNERKGESGHGMILAEGTERVAVNPVAMILASKKSDGVLKGIRDVVKDAGVRQFEGTRPGLIVCHLEGVEDLTSLASESGLQLMSYSLLNRPDFAHIAGISYCSDSRQERFHGGSSLFNQALIFRNPNCSFEQVKSYPFVSENLIED